MSQTTSFTEDVQHSFTPHQNGVLGFVHHLLAIACYYNLTLTYDDRTACVHTQTTGVLEPIIRPMPKSALREAIARIAH